MRSLVFTRKNPTNNADLVVRFPYVTSDEVTAAVLKAKSVDEQMRIIQEDVLQGYDVGGLWAEPMLERIEQMLRDKNLTLGIT